MKRNYYRGIINLLLELHKDHPTYELGNHLSTALSEYNNLWGIPDKEILAALKKYQIEISQEEDITEEYVNQIIEDGMNLEHILDENEEED